MHGKVKRKSGKLIDFLLRGSRNITRRNVTCTICFRMMDKYVNTLYKIGYYYK